MAFLHSRSRGCHGFLARDDHGATAVEYGIMVGFVAVVIALGVTAFGLSVKGMFDLIISTPPFQ